MTSIEELYQLSAAFAMDVVARRQPVHVASTDAEREAIFRMRYQVYVKERGEPDRAGVDHEKRWIHLPEDHLPETQQYYVGSPENLLGALRLRTWAPGKIPEKARSLYSLDRFPDIDARTICEITYLMARRGVRGTSQVFALVRHAMESSIRASRVDAMIAEATPALLHNYCRLGLRPYGARAVSSTYGLLVPLVGIPGDLEHSRRSGAPLYPMLLRLAGEGALSPKDHRPLLTPLARPGVELDAAAIAAEIEGVALAQGFLGRLGASTRRALCRQSCLLDVDAGTAVVVRGNHSRDLFVIVRGELEVVLGDKVLRRMAPGEVFGEISFFCPAAGQTTTIRTKSRCRLLHIRAGVLRRLAKQRASAALEVYGVLAEGLAERLADSG
jgi:hypothetical protein